MCRVIRIATAFSTFVLPAFLSGQNVPVDEGAFRLTVNGEVVGREDFSIRRVGRGSEARLILMGSVEMDLPDGRQSFSPAMEAGGQEMAVTAYQLRVTGARNVEIYVTRSDRRYMAKVISPEGEEVREFRAGPGSILLDREVAHQNYLLLPFLDRPDAVSLTVLSPLAGEQTRMTLRMVGEEEVRIGTELVRGRHYRLEGGEDSRDVWFDDQGRILKVALPARGYLAERESLG
jgi:hypothetical protein